MTGAEQEEWLLRGLRRSPARWNVIAQQTMFAEFDFTRHPDRPARPASSTLISGMAMSPSARV